MSGLKIKSKSQTQIKVINYIVIYSQELKIKMSGEGKIAIKWRIVISIIGTFILLALLRQMDNLYTAIALFIILFIAVSVATELASTS